MSLPACNFDTAAYYVAGRQLLKQQYGSKTSHNARDKYTDLSMTMYQLNSALTSNMSGAPGVLVEQRPGDERLPAGVAVEPLPRVDALVHLQRALLAERLAAVWGRFGVFGRCTCCMEALYHLVSSFCF